jgi:hypothetical protein
MKIPITFTFTAPSRAKINHIAAATGKSPESIADAVIDENLKRIDAKLTRVVNQWKGGAK